MSDRFDPSRRPPDKPCPNCGQQAAGFSSNNRKQTIMICTQCWFEGPAVDRLDSDPMGTVDRAAWKAWNTLPRKDGS